MQPHLCQDSHLFDYEKPDSDDDEHAPALPCLEDDDVGEPTPLADECETEVEGENIIVPEPPEKRRPTVEEYQLRWDEKLAFHNRSNSDPFAWDNLVPRPAHVLWQDCPYVSFEQLKSEEAQARLSMCRPLSGMHEAGEYGDGLVKYAHNTGSIFFAKRAPMQLTSTLGFVLNRNNGEFMHLTPQELDALHEIIHWGRIRGNNRILEFWGDELDQFSTACNKLVSRFRSIMPKGCNKARIRASARPTMQPKEDTMESTLGEESVGIVVIDLGGGAPLKYDQMAVFSDAVAKHTSIRLQLDIDDGKGWKQIEAASVGHDEPWRQDYVAGAQFLKDNTYVAASEEFHTRT